MNRPTLEETTKILNRWTGGESPRLLGHGMEGAVYEIDRDRVAKIWFEKSQPSLQRNSVFYEALAGKDFGFATPRIHEVHLIGDRGVTIEERLFGVNLTDHLKAGRSTLEAARFTFIDVLAELAASGPMPEARVLPVMGESVPLYEPAGDFAQALGDLVERRLAHSWHVLDPVVEELDKKIDALRDRLCEIDSGDRSFIHGDMILDNILVNDAGVPTAVLDWGFFTTEGDPAFDAAVAASIFDMYGEGALDTELGLYAQIEERLGYRRHALLVYRAAYSLVTANAYSVDGKDGHFAWCVSALNRPDVVHALLS